MKWASWAGHVTQAPREEGGIDLSRLASWASKVIQATREEGGRDLSRLAGFLI